MVLYFALGTLQNASPHGGQDCYTNGSGEGHLGGWSAAGQDDGVAVVCCATLNFLLVCKHQGAISGTGGAGQKASLAVEAHLGQ